MGEGRPAVRRPVRRNAADGSAAVPSWLRRWGINTDHAVTIALASAPIFGATLAYVSAMITWRGLGLAPGDFGLDVIDFAPSTALFTLWLGAGYFLGYRLMAAAMEHAKHDRDRLANLYGAVWMSAQVATAVIGIITPGPLKILNTAGGVFAQGAAMLGIGLILGGGQLVYVLAKTVGPKAARRFARFGVLFWALYALPVTLVTAAETRSLLERGEASAVGLLPFNQAGPVRYVEIIPLTPETANLASVRCAVSFGNGPGGRLLRVLMPNTQHVEMLVLDPQVVGIRAVPPCVREERLALWSGSLARGR